MGDISEIRGLIVAGTFITATILLISFIPAILFVSGETMQQITAPTFFEAIDIQSFADLHNFTLANTSGNTGLITMGGLIFQQNWAFGGSPATRITDIGRWDSFFIFKWFVEWGSFYKEASELGRYLTVTRLDSDYASEGIEGLEYVSKFEFTQFYVFFAFNETTYSSPQDAWEQSELHVLWAINFDQANTGYSAWDLIAMLLFFNLPTVHFLINALIAIPLWIAIVYITVIMMMRAIGAVFGGGA